MKSRLIFFFSLFIAVFQVSAQSPVQVQATILSPPSLKLSDYYTGSIPKIIVTLTNRDLQRENLEVYMNISITGPSLTLNSDKNKIYTSISLDRGIPKRLSLNELEEYFNPRNLTSSGSTNRNFAAAGFSLPEGLYTFCFEIYEKNTNRILNNKNQSCIVRHISVPPAPILISPNNGMAIIDKTPSFILFNWQPMHQSSPTSASNYQFEFELVEVLDKKIDVNNAFTSFTPIFSTKQKSTTLVYGPSKPVLIPGNRYAWRIRVLPEDETQDFDNFTNNGYSPVWWFDYQADCPSPQLTINASGSNTNVTWQGVKSISDYTLSYAQKSSSIFEDLEISSSAFQVFRTVPNLEPATEYMFNVNYTCIDGRIIEGEQLYTTPEGKDEIEYYAPIAITNISYLKPSNKPGYAVYKVDWPDKRPNVDVVNYFVYSKDKGLGDVKISNALVDNTSTIELANDKEYEIWVDFYHNESYYGENEYNYEKLIDHYLITGTRRVFKTDIDLAKQDCPVLVAKEHKILGEQALFTWEPSPKLTDVELYIGIDEYYGKSNFQKVSPINGAESFSYNILGNKRYKWYLEATCTDTKGNRQIKSETKTFVSPSNDELNDIISSKTIEFSGVVKGVYGLPSEEYNLISSDQKESSKEVLKFSADELKTINLSNATVTLMGRKTNGTYGVISSVKCNALGEYKFEIVGKKPDPYSKPYKIKVTYVNNAFNSIEETVKIETEVKENVRLHSSINDFNLQLKQIAFNPSIYAPGLTKKQQSNLVVDVLVETSYWNTHYKNLALDLFGTKSHSQVHHNNTTYTVVTELKENYKNEPIIAKSDGTKYMYRIRLADSDIEGESIEKIGSIDLNSNTVRYNFGLIYQLSRTLSGTIYTDRSGNGASGKEVTVTIPEDKVFKNNYYRNYARFNNTWHRKTVTTDEDGRYSVLLPPVEDGATIKVSTSSNAGFGTVEKEFAYESSKVNFKQDINAVQKEEYSFFGRVMYNGKPISNTRVCFNNSESVYTNSDGYFYRQHHWKNSRLYVSTNNFHTIRRDGDRQPVDIKSSKEWIEYIKNVPYIKEHLSSKTSFELTKGCVIKAATMTEQEIEDAYNAAVALNVGLVKCVDYGVFELEVDELPVKFNIKGLNNEVYCVFDIYDEDGKSIPGVSGFMQSLKSGVSLEKELEIGSYMARIKTTEYGDKVRNGIIPIEFDFEVKYGASNEFDITLQEAYPAKFLVTYKKGNNGKEEFGVLEKADITVEGLEQSLVTNSSGVAMTYIGLYARGRYNYTISKAGFKEVRLRLNRQDFIDKGIEGYPVTLQENFDAKITSISGFDVEITSQEEVAGRALEFKVSGNLLLTTNDLFSIEGSDVKLRFEDIIVTIPSSEKYLDKVSSKVSEDVFFEKSVIPATMYGNVPVELLNLHLTKNKGSSDYSKGVIRASKIEVKSDEISGLSSETKNVLTSINYSQYLLSNEFPNGATTRSYRYNTYKGESTSGYITCFAAKGLQINQLSSDKEFNIFYSRNGSFYQPKEVKVDMYANLKLTIETNKSVVTKEGVNMPGYFEAPKIAGIETPYKAEMSTFKIPGGGGDIYTGFSYEGATHKEIKMQKIKAVVTGFYINGLGSPNCVAGVKGAVQLFNTRSSTYKPRASRSRRTRPRNVVDIVKLEFRQSGQESTIAGQFKVPGQGIDIKGLNFKTTGGQFIQFAYNASDNTFELDAAGILNYVGTPNAVSRKIFEKPIEIRTFNLRTNTWSIFLVAGVNRQIDFGVVKVDIDAFAINLGTGVSLNEMNSLLALPVNQINRRRRSRTDRTVTRSRTVYSAAQFTEIDEASTNWAIGISGGIQFPVRQMNVKTKASLSFGNIDGKMDYNIGELELGIKNPAFTLSAKVKISISEEKTGFEAAAKLYVLDYGADAQLKFYHYPSKGIELGANITVSAGATGVVTGPVTWLSIGGGFNLNTVTSTYEVFLNGELTNTGNNKKTMYIAVSRLGILFNTNDCGIKPVLDGSGSLFIKEEKWLETSFTADFCRKLVLITINGKVPTLKGLPQVKASGVVFAAAESSAQANDHCLFILFNAQMKVRQLLDANVIVALGANVIKTRPYMPTDVLSKWPLIGQSALEKKGNYFNGIYLKAELDIPRKSGGFDAGKASVNYRFSANATGEFYTRFSSGSFGLKIAFDGNISAKAKVVGLTARGGASINGLLSGGYSNRIANNTYSGNKWYFNGSLNTSLYFAMGSDTGCNDWTVGGPSWSGWDPPGFKICKSLSASFNFIEGVKKDISISL